MGLSRRALANPTSVRTRFAVSLLTNGVRSIIGFVGGLLVARGLDPAGYGDLSFLLGSFAAFRTLLDMGTSTAFYTFISQRQRSPRFYLLYYLWLAIQFIVPCLLVAVVLPQPILQKIWLGHSRGVLLLALLATFLQQQLWQTINQVGEAARQTVKVQALNLVVGLGHIALIALMVFTNWVSVAHILWLYVVEYAVMTLVALPLWWVRPTHAEPETGAEVTSDKASLGAFFRETLAEYRSYCAPLVILSLATFLGDFLDKWFLQLFGGAKQQGLFQISVQFSAVSLLVTTSVLRIVWKEVSEANASGDQARTARIYQKVSRALLVFSAILSAAMIPWAKELVLLILGPRYLQAWPVLAIMFLYPIHQSMGQIGGTMLLATSRTRTYMWISLAIMGVSLAFSYLTQAPRSGLLIPGLALGAVGMGLKMVIVNVVSVNLQAYVIARHFEWRYDWLYQVVAVPLLLALGFLSKALITWMGMGQSLAMPWLASAGLLYGVLYLAGVVSLVWTMPWLVGLERAELRAILDRRMAVMRG